MLRTLLALLFALFFAGSGGGGNGSSSATTQTLSVPLLTAVGNLVNNGMTVNVAISGWTGDASAAVTGSGTFADAKAVSATLNGIAVLKTTETVTGTVTVNGSSSPLSQTTTTYENPTTYAEVVDDQGYPYIVFADFTYPTTVQAGDAAALATATMFSGRLQATKTGTLSLSFTVTVDTATALFWPHACLPLSMFFFPHPNVGTHQRRIFRRALKCPAPAKEQSKPS